MVTGEVSEPLVTCTACSLHRMSRHHERAIQSLSLSFSFSIPSFLHPLFLSCPSLSPFSLSSLALHSFFHRVYPSLSQLVQSYEREPVRETYVPIRTTLASRHSCFRMTSIMSIYSVDRALPLTAYEFQLEYVLSAAN